RRGRRRAPLDAARGHRVGRRARRARVRAVARSDRRALRGDARLARRALRRRRARRGRVPARDAMVRPVPEQRSMPPPAVTFFVAPGASSMAPHTALHEVGVPFESRPLSLARRETRSPAFLAINPEGQVPTLLVDGRPLTEVAAILFYLARRFPDARLLPENDLEAAAQVVSWMSFLASTVHPARRQGLDHARGVWEVADGRLGSREWAVDGRYSIADIHLFRLYWRFSNAFPAGPGEFPNLSAHYQRMMAR